MMETKVCTKCKNRQDNEPIYENCGTKAEIIRFINEEKYSILVNGKTCAEQFDINYCPFCGRALKGEIGSLI